MPKKKTFKTQWPNIKAKQNLTLEQLMKSERDLFFINFFILSDDIGTV